MLNWIWLGLIVGSLLYAGFTGRMDAVQLALFEGAKQAVELVIGLVGVMAFMLGAMQVGFDAGLREWIARALAPIMRRIFPEVPPDHPAMSAIVMNMASNVLGLGNAATPFGLKAMSELSRLNPHPGVASNAMVLFLAINTSAITLLPPSGTVGVRLAAGSEAPMAIWIPTLIATTCSTLLAVTMALALRRLPWFRIAPAPSPAAPQVPLPAAAEDEPDEAPAEPQEDAERVAAGPGRLAFVGATLLATVAALVHDATRRLGEGPAGDAVLGLVQAWAFPLLLIALLLMGVARRVPVYESAIAGAREGLEVALRIVPYLVAILAAVAMLRASGALDELLIPLLRPLTQALGVPPEVMPMALLRPLSGSGAFGVMSETLTTHGPDGFIGMMTSTLQGSTETTFYVLALYLGAAGVKDGRHTLAACLSGDVAGFLGAAAACHWFFG